MKAVRTGVVSVVLVNYKGVEDTLTAIEHVRQVDWPAELLEIVVVDNASGDDSITKLKALGNQIKLIALDRNTGFAGGCNAGVKAASGEYIALLNNDARPDGQWIRAAVVTMRRSSKIGAIACRVLDWEGQRVDYISAGMTWYGMGFKPHTGDLHVPEDQIAHPVLFATGSGMFIRRAVFDEVGGFDERFFMFFEDVDLGWRINLAGYSVIYQPQSLVFHKHHASMKSFGEYKERYLLERNALFTLYKNASDAQLGRVLAPAMALAVRRGVARGGLDNEAFDLRRGDDDTVTELPTAKETVAPILAIDAFIDALPGLAIDRERIQSRRRVGERHIARLMGQTDIPAFDAERYLEGYSAIVDQFDVLSNDRLTTVVIITGDPLGAKVAGPAIRARAIADALSLSHDVTLVSLTSSVPDPESRFTTRTIRPGDDRTMSALLKKTDVVIFQGLAMELFPSVASYRGILVADVYDPMHFEQLEQARKASRSEWDEAVRSATATLNHQLQRADYIICASERQRLMYLGQLAALGRINPANYALDGDLRTLIDTVPFGLDSSAPVQTRHAIKGSFPGIGVDDTLLVWGGGLYDWFDPHTLIRAVADLAKRRPSVRLLFLGTAHPNPDVPEMPIVASSRSLAKALGVLDTHVFFNDTWVEFADRHNYLLDADIAVSTHGQHVETTFSFRTRVLDYLWAGLPMVLTDGDSFADLAKAEKLGITVEAGNVAELSAALERVAFEPEFAQDCRSNVQRVREQFTWERVLAPLVAFVENPSVAADRINAVGSRHSDRLREHRPRPQAGLRRDLSMAWFVLRTLGPSAVVDKVLRRSRRKRMARKLERRDARAAG